MVEEGNIFTCVKGRMPTSIDLARRLREFAATSGGTTSSPASALGGKWFCPCCATFLEERKEHYECAGCGRNLGKSVISIPVEFHPHWTNNRWR